MTTRAAYVRRSTAVECAEGLAFHSPGIYYGLSKCVDEPNLQVICRQGGEKGRGEGEKRRGGEKESRRGEESRGREKGRGEGEEKRRREKGRGEGEGRREGERKRGGEKGRGEGKGRRAATMKTVIKAGYPPTTHSSRSCLHLQWSGCYMSHNDLHPHHCRDSHKIHSDCYMWDCSHCSHRLWGKGGGRGEEESGKRREGEEEGGGRGDGEEERRIQKKRRKRVGVRGKRDEKFTISNSKYEQIGCKRLTYACASVDRVAIVSVHTLLAV